MSTLPPDEPTSILTTEEEIAFLKDRVVFLERQYAALDTQIDATEQALAAQAVSEKNREKIRALDERLEVAIRSFQGFACVLAGALLLWFGNPLINDANPANDRVAEWLFGGGGSCVAYGLLVLTNNDQFVLKTVLDWLSTINPWRK